MPKTTRTLILGLLCRRQHRAEADPTKSWRSAHGACWACVDYMSGRTTQRDFRAEAKARVAAEKEARRAAREAKAANRKRRGAPQGPEPEGETPLW